MTNQEAIEILREKIFPCVTGDWKEAVGVAISALQAQGAKTQLSAEGTTSDLISRQAAIDALDSFILDETTNLQGDSVREILESLPSAQPEIVRCGQCKYAEVADAQDNQDGYTCQFHRGSIWFSGSYCSWGERRADEGSDRTPKGD